MEMWGLGVIGLSVSEFYSLTIPLFNRIFEGFLLRETEIRNIGIRRVYSIIYNGFNSLGGGTQQDERKLWPMSMDKFSEKMIVPPSEELVKKDWDLISKIWPDVKLDG